MQLLNSSMKKIVLCCALFFISYLHAADEVITPELLKLLEYFHLIHDGSLTSITDATQKAWLRPKGKERWETVDPYTFADRVAVMDYYTKTGKFDAILPTKKSYDTAIICGATVGRMQMRISYLEKLIQEGVEVKKVALLTGMRILDSAVEQIPAGCTTEGEAMLALWKKSPLSSKIAWSHLEHPLIQEKAGSMRRPWAHDNFTAWVKGESPSTIVVIVSNQPYCCFFDAVAQAAFPQGFPFEVVGDAADLTALKTDILLDNLARWIYMSQNVNITH